MSQLYEIWPVDVYHRRHGRTHVPIPLRGLMIPLILLIIGILLFVLGGFYAWWVPVVGLGLVVAIIGGMYRIIYRSPDRETDLRAKRERDARRPAASVTAVPARSARPAEDREGRKEESNIEQGT